MESYVFYRDSGTGYNFLSTDGGTPTGREVPENKNAALADDTAYIEYTSFMYNSDVQLGEALSFMASRGRTKLILDLARQRRRRDGRIAEGCGILHR